MVGIGVVGARVAAGVGGMSAGAGVAGAQAVRTRLRHKPRIENHRRLCIGISPFLIGYTLSAKRKFPKLFAKAFEPRHSTAPGAGETAKATKISLFLSVLRGKKGAYPL